MSAAVVVSSDRDKHRPMNMGPKRQQQALVWEQTRLDKVSENVSPTPRLKGEQRKAGDAREHLCGAGAEVP